MLRRKFKIPPIKFHFFHQLNNYPRLRQLAQVNNEFKKPSPPNNHFPRSLFGAGFCTGFFAFTQNHLAKHDNKSPFYWRNNLKFSDAVFQIAHHKHVDFLMTCSRIFTASQLDSQQVIKTMRVIRALRSLQKVIDKLDDAIDDAKADQVLKLGETTLGPELSPFLQNLLDADDKLAFNQLVTSGLITQNELYSFGNLFAKKLFIQAQLTLRYEQESDPEKRKELRKQIAQENIEISGINLVLMFHCIKRNEKLKGLVHQSSDNELTFERLREFYPTEIKAGKLIQILHDISEFRYDLRQEPVIGKICANYFLAELEASGLIKKYHHELSQLPDRPASFHELPVEIQNFLTTIERDFKNEARTIGKSTALAYGFSWNYETAVGYCTQKPRR